MFEKADFAQLVERAMAAPFREHMRPVVEKELLHYDILSGLAAEGLLEALTFQGGTALRLCYGAPRFSEDLDFAGGRDFAARGLDAITACIKHCIGDRYGFDVQVREPHGQERAGEQAGRKIARWRIAVATAPQRKDMPKQRLKLEIADIPAYSRELKALHGHHPEVLPDGYGDTLVFVESLDELMADKLVSLAGAGRPVRYRDIWDLSWLQRKGAKVRRDWVMRKAQDYRIANYPALAHDMAQRLPDIIRSDAFAQTLSRFLPDDVRERTLQRPGFDEYLAREVAALLEA